MEHILVDYAVRMSSKDSDSYALCDFWTHHNSEKQMTNCQVREHWQTNEVPATGM